MPVEPPHDRHTPRGQWSRRAAHGSVAALTALTALGTVGAAQAAPATAQTVKVAQQHTGQVTVAPGDSVWSLAARHGVGVAELMAANDIPPHGMIRPGQRLRIPEAPNPAEGKGSPAEAKNAAKTSPAGGGSAPAPTRTHHRVAAGDTLWDLAQRYEVNVADLMRANSLTPNDVLRPGRTLTVPGAPRDAAPARGTGAAASSPAPEPSGTTAPDGEPAVGDSFAGRQYPREVVDSANAHHEQLRSRDVPPPEQIRQMVEATARDMGVDPALALAHASQESGFRHDVVSPADAVGTMQVVPAAGEWASDMVGRQLDLLDPQDNITAGVAIIRELQDRAPDKATGIGAYYQGLHGVTTYGMYSDTKAYVKAVSAQERKFAQ
ncbi:LysM peptidoglycan-binding domain-containing protein [Kocuria rhizophila]|uniref:LysM peptidoglycan-binding domain-containing protein n=1 Tax=Kocuria rhizophila TaxID=72000 RepID=UPI000F5444D7|nr:LysM peptidoglycan-binding domain-containing protein [Kocuria rhizophila]